MIDYNKIADSIEFFESKDFVRIESPWTVTKKVAQITAPENASYWSIQEKEKVLVASGEQSFLYLYLKGFLPKGRFQTVTPCFRNELFDKIHTKYFVKNELIDTKDVTTENLARIVETAFEFFGRWTESDNISIVPIADSFDIEINGIEVGSYGIRSCEYLDWIYATACAEPRLSYALNIKE